ncbi:MAG TPA: hypothetical protein PL188_04280 [Candidatus Cloacimonadota bacterium]|nr:hypothetical protein [Candidatus Cloacimonadota bacterium]
MFEALGSKLLAGVVSLSMLLFSTYTGNDPKLSGIRHTSSDSYIHLEANLISAFENDFPSIFTSGTTIPVQYQLTFKSGNRTVINRTYTNSVTFDPGKGTYEIRRAGTADAFFTRSYEEMLAVVSLFKVSVPYQVAWGTVHVKLESSLPTVSFAQVDKAVDLMILWKYKKPSAKTQIDLRKIF